MDNTLRNLTFTTLLVLLLGAGAYADDSWRQFDKDENNDGSERKSDSFMSTKSFRPV